jgi:hypothetical protein
VKPILKIYLNFFCGEKSFEAQLLKHFVAETSLACVDFSGQNLLKALIAIRKVPKKSNAA